MKDIWEYILKNKYVIICVAIVVMLYSLGIVELLTKFILLVALVVIAIFVGKTMQENEKDLSKLFKRFASKVKAVFSTTRARGNEEVYYYQEESSSKKSSSKKSKE